MDFHNKQQIGLNYSDPEETLKIWLECLAMSMMIIYQIFEPHTGWSKIKLNELNMMQKNGMIFWKSS